MLAEAVANGPDREAVVSGETRLSYAQFDDEVARVAGGLSALGVGQGDRVALLLGNGIPFVALTYAAARLGATTVPMSIRDQMPGIRHALANSGASALIVEAAFARIVPDPEETPSLRSRIVVGAEPGYLDYETLRSHEPLRAAAEMDEEEVATILYTSGTTGVPKGAMLTGLGIVHSATNFMQAMALGPEDRTIVVAPMSRDPCRRGSGCDARVQGPPLPRPGFAGADDIHGHGSGDVQPLPTAVGSLAIRPERLADRRLRRRADARTDDRAICRGAAGPWAHERLRRHRNDLARNDYAP
jgi:hypothetical protein